MNVEHLNAKRFEILIQTVYDEYKTIIQDKVLKSVLSRTLFKAVGLKF